MIGKEEMKASRAFRLYVLYAGLGLGLSSIASMADPPASAPLRKTLAGPMPVCFAVTTPEEAFSSLQRHLVKSGFRLKINSNRRGELFAVKSQGEGIEGRYLVWLSRGLEDYKKVEIFVEYGRFEDQLGKGLTRVIIDEAEEGERLGEFMRILSSPTFSCPQRWLESEIPLPPSPPPHQL